MIRIGIGLSLIALAGFAATAAVDRHGEPAEKVVVEFITDPPPGSLPLPAWHPPVLPEGYSAVLPPGHPPILPQGHPPVAGDALACPGGGMLPGRIPGVGNGPPAEAPKVLSI